jgi:hypothetical protein
MPSVRSDWADAKSGQLKSVPTVSAATAASRNFLTVNLLVAAFQQTAYGK